MAPKADGPNSLLVPGFADQHLLFLWSAPSWSASVSPPWWSAPVQSSPSSSDQHQAHQPQPPLMISTKLISLSLLTSSDQHIVILLMDYSCIPMPNIRPHRHTVDSIVIRSFLISCTHWNVAGPIFWSSNCCFYLGYNTSISANKQSVWFIFFVLAHSHFYKVFTNLQLGSGHLADTLPTCFPNNPVGCSAAAGFTSIGPTVNLSKTSRSLQWWRWIYV